MHDNKTVKRVAQERVQRLLDLAYDRTYKSGGRDQLAKRYISLARHITSHYKIPTEARLRKYTCTKCNSTLIPGRNCTVRLVQSKGYLSYKCECGHENHIFYRKRRPT